MLVLYDRLPAKYDDEQKSYTIILEKSAINVYYDAMHRKIITNQLQKRLVNMFRC